MIRIERMREAHVPQVAALEQVCFHDPWSENSIRAELDNELSFWLVALDKDTVAGYVGSQTVLEESDMMNVAVAPDYRRQGVGELLIRNLMSCLRESGSHCLSLEVRESNFSAINLYKKLSFVQVGKRPGYYRNPKEAALILRREWSL